MSPFKVTLSPQSVSNIGSKIMALQPRERYHVHHNLMTKVQYHVRNNPSWIVHRVVCADLGSYKISDIIIPLL